MTTRARTFASLSLALALVVPAAARAQSAADKAAAQALFDDAQKLGSAGNYSAACPKYEESNRLDPGIGVKLYLADCYERIGKTASAWGMYEEAEDYAHKANDAREKVAKQHADKLAPTLVKVVIVVAPEARIDGLTVKRDGEEVGAGQWGVEVPIDPGHHVVSVVAPGHKEWMSTVEAKEGAGPIKVDVPKLVEVPVASPPPPQPASSPAPSVTPAASPPQDEEQGTSSRGSTQRLIGIVVGGAGIVGIGIGSAFGLIAKSNLDDSNSNGHCHGNLCDQTGIDLRVSAKSNALSSTIAFSVGAAALAGGVVIWLTAPKAHTVVGLTPLVTDRVAGVTLGGRL